MDLPVIVFFPLSLPFIVRNSVDSARKQSFWTSRQNISFVDGCYAAATSRACYTNSASLHPNKKHPKAFAQYLPSILIALKVLHDF